MKIRVQGKCVDGDCDCHLKNNADVKDAGMPPFHEGCTCVVIKDFTEEFPSLEGKVYWLA